MPARRGPRADQIDQGNAVAGQVITAGLLFPSFEDNEGGGGGVTDATAAPAILPVQDVIQPQAITDVDDIIDTPLSLEPFDPDSVIVFLNGIAQVQGTGRAYEIVVDTNGNTAILWLAGTGTAVNLTSSDQIIVLYQVAV